ncbi:MAG TPA: TMEM175 family protein [Puia sp.]|nr:TMEM175 family protein [Puia sp.]
MLRKAFFGKLQTRNTGFHFRGHEVKRIETFSDAVFAFAVTLLIVSLEVPKSFEELVFTMRGFFAFGICFTLLMLIWHEQHIFFRRYGMEDTLTVVLNSALIFIVLFYVYPLKFLFTIIFSDGIYGQGKSPFSITVQQSSSLMVIYGVGYIIIYFIFMLMYLHAYRNKTFLQLTTLELYDTRTKIYSQVILISVGVISVMTALLLPPKNSGLAGAVYGLIGIALTLFYSIRGRRRRKLYHPPQ